MNMKVIVVPQAICFGAHTCMMSLATDYGCVVTVSISEECEYLVGLTAVVQN